MLLVELFHGIDLAPVKRACRGKVGVGTEGFLTGGNGDNGESREKFPLFPSGLFCLFGFERKVSYCVIIS